MWRSTSSDGRAWRYVRLASATAARAAFERVARKLYALEGVEWRRRAIEGVSSLRVGRAQLRLDATDVALEIDVEAAVWKQFTGV